MEKARARWRAVGLESDGQRREVAWRRLQARAA